MAKNPYKQRLKKLIGARSYSRVRKRVLNRLGKCFICGCDNEITIHHLVALKDATYETIRDIDYIVPLCRKHHKDYHNSYTRKNTSQQTFERWLLSGVLNV